MKLWTIQLPEVFLQNLNENKAYRTDASKIDWPEFLPAYDWLCKHLEAKSPRPEGVSYPIWAWHTFAGKRKKPDLRYSGYGTRGTKLVCLELEIPDDKVLLSDFELFHFCLNKWWLDPEVFNNPNYNEETYDKNHAWFKSLSPERQQEELEKSWRQILDVTPFESDWIRRGSDIQAIFWELKPEYIRKVQFFTAR